MTYKIEELKTYCKNCGKSFSLLNKHRLNASYCDNICKQRQFRKRSQAKVIRKKWLKPVTEEELKQSE